MGLTVHERDFFKQSLSKPKLCELLAGSLRLLGLNGRQVECPLR
jgi:hypothetical protein